MTERSKRKTSRLRLGGVKLNEEQRKWYKQYISNLGAKEFFRLAAAMIVWIFLGVVLSVVTRAGVLFAVFFFAMFAFAAIAPRWKPTYFLLRKIVGNQSLPLEPFPRNNGPILPSQARPWWSYLPSIWWLLIDLLLLLAVLGYLSRK